MEGCLGHLIVDLPARFEKREVAILVQATWLGLVFVDTVAFCGGGYDLAANRYQRRVRIGFDWSGRGEEVPVV